MSPKWFIGWAFVFPLLKILTGIRIRGKVPKKGPCIIAANHVSFLDPPVLGLTAFREIYFLAKQGLFRVSPFFSWLITTYNAMQVHGTEGMIRAVQLLRQGKAVVIFPEGTRSRKGHMLPFNPGIGYLAISLGVPVVPAYIANSDKRFFNLMLRIHSLKVSFGAPVFPRGFAKTKEEYQRFADRIREEVIKLK
jgi:1-acyl-sn-glycerol-3-phosphate acyltransferase